MVFLNTSPSILRESVFYESSADRTHNTVLILPHFLLSLLFIYNRKYTNIYSIYPNIYFKKITMPKRKTIILYVSSADFSLKTSFV